MLCSHCPYWAEEGHFAEEQDLLWRYGDNYVEYYQAHQGLLSRSNPLDAKEPK